MKNTPKQIRERREAIVRLMAHGYYLEGDIAVELKISRRIVRSDMRYINEMNNKHYYELAKANPLTVCSDYVSDLDKILKEYRKIYDDPATNANDKILALRSMTEVNDTKIAMFHELLEKHHNDDDMT